MLTSELIEDIAATAEVCGGSKWSAAAVRIACAHLRQFSEPAIRQSLLRCQQEVKGTLALADIIARMPDGRPSPDVAWSQVSGPETETFVTTDEAMEAWAAARPLVAAGDEVAARMAFLARYREICAQGRTSGRKPNPYVSVGSDRSRAETVIKDAVARGILEASDSQARGVLSQASVIKLADGSECDGVKHFVRIPPGDEWPQGAFRLTQCKCPPRKALPCNAPRKLDKRIEIAGLLSDLGKSLEGGQ